MRKLVPCVLMLCLVGAGAMLTAAMAGTPGATHPPYPRIVYTRSQTIVGGDGQVGPIQILNKPAQGLYRITATMMQTALPPGCDNKSCSEILIYIEYNAGGQAQLVPVVNGLEFGTCPCTPAYGQALALVDGKSSLSYKTFGDSAGGSYQYIITVERLR